MKESQFLNPMLHPENMPKKGEKSPADVLERKINQLNDKLSLELVSSIKNEKDDTQAAEILDKAMTLRLFIRDWVGAIHDNAEIEEDDIEKGQSIIESKMKELGIDVPINLSEIIALKKQAREFQK